MAVVGKLSEYLMSLDQCHTTLFMDNLCPHFLVNFLLKQKLSKVIQTTQQADINSNK